MASSRNLPSTDPSALIATALSDSLRPILLEGRRLQISVAYSGGLDSSVLLHAVSLLKNSLASPASAKSAEFQAIHIHHGLSCHADDWQRHCERYAEQWGIPLLVERVTLDREISSLENEARLKRRESLNRQSGDVVLMAHHRDDQAETLLLNLFRGTGLLGAAGIPYQEGKILRPFLHLPRSVLKDYAQSQGLVWVEDESNDDPVHRRNRVRHTILPCIAEHFPAAIENLAASTTAFSESQQLLEELAKEDGAEQTPLPLALLRELEKKSLARATNALIFNLRLHGLRLPSKSWVYQCYQQLISSREDGEVAVRIGSMTVRRYRDHMYVENEAAKFGVPVSQLWTGMDISWGAQIIRTSLTKGTGISIALLTGHAEFRPRRGGECMALRGGFHREVKDLLREAGIPPWLR